MRLPLILRSRAQRGVSKGEARALVAGTALRQQPQPQILRHIRVLILVDQDVFEAPLILPQHFRMLAKKPDGLEQQVAEVGRVEDFQALLERRVELEAAPARKAR